MAFTFGGINANRKRNNNQAVFDYVLLDNVSGPDYYLILVDYVLKPGLLQLFNKDLKSKNLTNYIIASTITADNLKKDGTAALLEVESPWKSLLNHKGFNVKAILCTGAALRVINRCADLIWTDFLDTWFNNPFYLGNNKYLGLPEGIKIFPVAPIDIAYPLKEGIDSFRNWTTRHLEEQIVNMTSDFKSYYDYDLRPCEIISVSGE
jgi:hypothetical protein